MLASSLCILKPHPSYKPPLPTSTTSSMTNTIDNTTISTVVSKPVAAVAAVAEVPNVTIDEAMKAPQFHLLGVTFFCLATGVST
jgi:hypothetical protein